MPDDLQVGAARITTSREERDVRIAALPVVNTTSSRVHVWATPRAITYDPTTRTLWVRFAENPVDLDDATGIEVISAHPRLPAEEVIEPGESGRLQVRIPPVLRVVDLGAPSGALGLVWQEVPVGPIDHIAAEIAVADSPFSELAGKAPMALVRELRAVPRVMTATVDATSLTHETEES